MSSTIIDETVILRYLLNDDEVLSPRAAKVIATRTARVYPEIITRVVVTLRDVYKVPRVEIATAMTKLLDDVMVDEPTVIALAIKLFGKTHMDFTDCLLAARTAIYNDDVVSFGKPIIQGMIDYRRQRQTAADARDRGCVTLEGRRIDDVKGFYKLVGGRAGVTEYYMYDATNIRLRELAVSYALPQKLVRRTRVLSGVTLSLVARNLFFIYNAAPFDPDLILSTGNDNQGIEVYGMPTVRNTGFNIKLEF